MLGFFLNNNNKPLTFSFLKIISDSQILNPETTVTFEGIYRFYRNWSFNNLTPVRNASSTVPSWSVILRENPLYPQCLSITDYLLYPLLVVGNAKIAWQKYMKNTYTMTLLQRSFNIKSCYPNHTVQSVELTGLQNSQFSEYLPLQCFFTLSSFLIPLTKTYICSGVLVNIVTVAYLSLILYKIKIIYFPHRSLSILGHLPLKHIKIHSPFSE